MSILTFIHQNPTKVLSDVCINSKKLIALTIK